MEKTELQKLSHRFLLLSELSMKESEVANRARNWVKGDLKERESETWLEAHRMTSVALKNIPPTAGAKQVPSFVCQHDLDTCKACVKTCRFT